MRLIKQVKFVLLNLVKTSETHVKGLTPED